MELHKKEKTHRIIDDTKEKAFIHDWLVVILVSLNTSWVNLNVNPILIVFGPSSYPRTNEK